MSRMIKVGLSELILMLGILAFYPGRVMASTACVYQVSPNEVVGNDEVEFQFNLTNVGDGRIEYLKIYAPSEHFDMMNYGVEGWKSQGNRGFIEMYNNVVGGGEAFEFRLSVRTAAVDGVGGEWRVEVLGDELVECVGENVGVVIQGVLDTQVPRLSEPEVRELTSRSAVIYWTTDEPATSFVNYGSTEDYGESVGRDELSVEHELKLEGLLPYTTYYYEYGSSDNSGNTDSVPDWYSFTTLEVVATPTAAVVPTMEPTPTEIPEPTWIPAPTPKFGGRTMVFDEVREMMREVFRQQRERMRWGMWFHLLHE